VLVPIVMRIAVHPVAGAEMPFEVGGPQVVGAHASPAPPRPDGSAAGRRRFFTSPWRASKSPAVLGAGQSMSGARRASHCRSIRGPPARVRLARRTDPLRHVRGNAMRAVVRARLRSRSAARPPSSMRSISAYSRSSCHVVPRTTDRPHGGGGRAALRDRSRARTTARIALPRTWRSGSVRRARRTRAGAADAPAVLARRAPDIDWPAPSTAGDLLARQGS